MIEQVKYEWVKRCVNCFTINNENKNFCGGCGMALVGEVNLDHPRKLKDSEKQEQNFITKKVTEE